ncbi:phosphoinositide phospholipase C Plc1 [Schizosaccharomyces japonicus yFS275]|uniref:Phosphoinositide phospholipase C n=1 Tax=Schizosaccharomyces japonicus (strain yFS275 / FY16936) TaxID=402676 RepID=B6JVB4_SCHJY|nr:phosphoinositide phospholipase C Plc1 [Schizosaccharomyces japonicus yFS275]EEB05315.2 phosphoinositide phospholipase C Plc1 [Schizosaccharomyces japonicus yFS275]
MELVQQMNDLHFTEQEATAPVYMQKELPRLSRRRSRTMNTMSNSVGTLLREENVSMSSSLPSLRGPKNNKLVQNNSKLPFECDGEQRSASESPNANRRPSFSFNLFGLKLQLLARSHKSKKIPHTQESHSHSFLAPSTVHGCSDQISESSHLLSTIVPESIQSGCFMLRITRKKVRQRKVSLDPYTGDLLLDRSATKSYKKLCVDDVKAIRSGADARNYREQFKISAENEERWFTIIYMNAERIKALHLISPTVDMKNQWLMALGCLKSYRLSELTSGLELFSMRPPDTESPIMDDSVAEPPPQAVPSAFLEKRQNARLSFHDVEKMCQKLHLNASRSFLRSIFSKADVEGTGSLSFDGFQTFVKLLKTREEVTEIFKKYSNNGSVMTEEQFSGFLYSCQKFIPANKSAQQLFQKFSKKDAFGMDVLGFSSFLLSPENHPVTQVDQDMTRPLNEYLISSSHNTYLLGRQFAGESSIEGYIRSLQRGCKCIEIDCWDGPTGPSVYHGRTFTTSIPFIDVIRVIKKYAFVASPYPVIISLEIHCSCDQQIQMAKIMREIFGEALVSTHLSSNESVLPSPADLLYRILLKVKCSPSGPALTNPGFVDSSTDTTGSSEFDNSIADGDSPQKPKRKSRKLIVPELQELSTYSRSIKFRNFSLPESKTYDHIFSFSERTISRFGKSIYPHLKKHNTKYLCRVYPAPIRLGSSNFNPQFYWRLGVQMVALNWQTPGKLGLHLNDALFASDPPCGFLLKPIYQRPNGSDYREKNSNLSPPLPCKIKLTIHVITGQQLRRSRESIHLDTLSPYVEINVHSLEETPIKWSSKVVSKNGFRPLWDEYFYYESATVDDEYSIIRFLVHHKRPNGDVLVARFASPLYRLKEGYRHLPLYDLQGEQLLFSTLFVHITKTYVPPTVSTLP